MKRSNLFIGLVYLLFGICFCLLAILFDTKLESLLFGFSGAGIGGGIVMLWKYYYWNRQENRKLYEERLEKEDIEMHDERKERLRDKSGRYAYIINLIVLFISIVVFSLLKSLEIVKNAQLIILYLSGMLVFQYIIGIVIFKRLEEKY